MRLLVIAAVLAGCGSKPPRRVGPDPEQPIVAPASGASSEPPIVRRPPRFRLIGALTGPTWPLVGPPSLEPHYRVTSPWFASCERRGRLADDALAYVEAWCRYRADPTGFDLLAALLPLRRSTTSGLGDAVYRDVANFVVESRSVQAALTWVATAVNREPAFTSYSSPSTSISAASTTPCAWRTNSSRRGARAAAASSSS